MASQISIGAFYSTLHAQIGVHLQSDSDSKSDSGSDSPGTRTREQRVLDFIQRAQNNNNISSLSTPLNGFLWKASVIKPKLELSIMDFVNRFSSMFSVSSRSNMEVIHACASFLSLNCNPPPKEDEIWNAITNLLHAAAASLPQPDPDTPPLSATFPSSSQLPASFRIHRQVETPPPPEESQGRVNPSHITPQKPPSEVVDDTPFRANSSWLFSNSGQTHELVDPYLRAELRDTVFRDVHGFHNFFRGITQEEWNCAANCPATCSCQWSDTLHNNTIAPDLIAPFPSQLHPPERSVIDWFTQFNQNLLSRQFCGSGSRPLGDSSCVRQCDVFLAPTATDPIRHSWLEVLVPGELKASPINDSSPDTILQLAGYVREIFGAQVNRRFVHGFTICGSLFRCYLFDRSGVSISNRFNIRKNTKTHNLIVRILSGYSAMSEQQLGFDTNYTDANGMPFIPSRSLPSPTHLSYNGRRFRLISKLFHRPVIVSRGTVCWLAEDLLTGTECIVKDSWRAGWRTSEGELLTIAEDKGVWGVPKAVVHGDVTIPCTEGIVEDRICVLRSHLSYSTSARIVLAERHADGIYLLSSAMIKPVTESPIAIPEVPRSKKRASVDQLSSNKSKLAKIAKNQPSSVHSAPAENVNALSQNAPAGSTQGKLSSAGSRRSRSSTNNLTNQNRPSVGLKASQLSSSSILISPGTDLNPLSNPPKRRFMDLTHSIIVSIPVGKRIDQFDSIQELLEAFRDAIRCHQSLVEVGNILHRDVSPNNIMISKDDAGPKGFLIDLDLAKQIRQVPICSDSSAATRRRTGTMLFMAIEVLEGSAPHTWRHDLESFFYVLIWLCVTAPSDSDPSARKALEAAWSVKDAASNKLVQICQDARFIRLLEWFAPSMAELGILVEEIRNVLFPSLVGVRGVFTGTLEDRPRVYRTIISLIDEFICTLRESSDSEAALV